MNAKEFLQGIPANFSRIPRDILRKPYFRSSPAKPLSGEGIRRSADTLEAPGDVGGGGAHGGVLEASCGAAHVLGWSAVGVRRAEVALILVCPVNVLE